MAQIKKDTSLRKSILQAAITGQLISTVVESVETTIETGKQLLDRIIEERNQKLLADWNEALKKNPKAKKPAPIVASEIDEDEIPFEIPENWCWCRLDDLFLHNTGKALNKAENKEGTELEYITTSNLYWNHFELDNLKTMLFKDSEIEKCTVHKGDLLVCEGGEVGRTAIWNFDRTVCIQNHIHKLRAYESSLNKKFYYYVMFLYKEGKVIEDYAKGIGIKGLSSNALGSIILPLPPLSVQNAIVAKLEQVLPLVEAYENAVLQKEELKSTLSDKVKKAVLQEAITKKLTEEWRKSAAITENGEQLLARIIKERNAKALAEWEEKALSISSPRKSKVAEFSNENSQPICKSTDATSVLLICKNKKLKKPVPIVASEIEENEIPFEVPESWYWCHLGEICNEIKRGKSPKYVDRSDYLAFAQKCNVKTGGIDLGLALYLDEKTIDRYSKEDNLMQGDVVINSTGGGTMGRVGYYETKVPDGIKGVYPDSHVTVIRSVGKINQRYLYYVLKHNQPILEDCGTGSTNQTELKPGILASFVIPLPPLEEQEEIVKKVEELLPLCK